MTQNLVQIFEQFNVKKSLTEIKSWISKNKSQILEKKKIGILSYQMQKILMISY